MTTRFIRSHGLQERGIVDSWAQLDNLVKKYGFPRGRKLGPNTRVWDLEEEVEPWLAGRPQAACAPRGAAKRAKSRPPKDRKADTQDKPRGPAKASAAPAPTKLSPTA
jgi:predicted DNA-binding transcriptional regulator AlpA